MTLVLASDLGGASLEADVCIIGSGAAGISIALELEDRGFTAVMLESGELERSEASMALNQGEAVGIPFHFDAERLRYFGGSTNHWGGWCVPLSDADVVHRAWMPDLCRWPLTLEQLAPFYEEAARVLEIGPPRFVPQEWAERIPLSIPSSVKDNVAEFQACVWQISTPTRFGTRFRAAVSSSSRLRAITGLCATEIVTSVRNDHVEAINARSLRGAPVTVRARVYVLCAGGLENPRLLLLSTRSNPNGVGNSHGNVGRYYMSHPGTWSALECFGIADNAEAPNWRSFGIPLRARGFVSPRKQRPSTLSRALRGQDTPAEASIVFGAALTWRTQVRERLPQFWVVPAPAESDDPQVREEARATLNALYGGKAPSMYRLNVAAAMEQQPNPESRVLLGDRVDPLGQRVLRLDWRLRSNEREQYARCLELFARQFTRSGTGRARVLVKPTSNDWIPVAGGHHMGTTRMADRPEDGVVDRDLKVHGIDNLFVAGGSVFPTPGFGNPTLTIVALALRLRERLVRHLR